MEEELKLAPVLIEGMPPMQFLGLIKKRFGVRRATELIGWAILMGAAGIENGPKVRHALEEVGYNDSAMYRAMADLRKLGEFVEQEYHAKMTVQQLVVKIGDAVNNSSV